MNPGNSRLPCWSSVSLTSMMTPQILITIPHAAIFGPQNSSDGMSVFELIDRSEEGFYFWFTKLRNDPSKDERAWRSADPHHSVTLGESRLLSWHGAQRPMKTSYAPAPPFPVRLANGVQSPNSRSISFLPSPLLHDIHIFLLNMLNINNPQVFHGVWTHADPSKLRLYKSYRVLYGSPLTIAS